MRDIIFSDPNLRLELEAILHPRIRTTVREQVESVNAPYCMVVIPLLLELLEVRGSRLVLVTLGPILVLVGGYLLRQVMMDVGQVSTWTQYESQYDMQLLQRLEPYHENF